MTSEVVAFVTTLRRPGHLRRAMEAGASGFVVRTRPRGDWPTRSAASTPACGSSTPGLAAESLAAGPNTLTDRERDALRAARDGATVSAIARHVLPGIAHPIP